MEAVPDDTREQLELEADHLYETMAIIRRRFPTGKYEDTRLALRTVAVDLLSRARHPSRGRILTVETAEVRDDLV